MDADPSSSTESLAGPVPRDHVVAFYEHDDELIGTVARYVARGLQQGETGVLLATAAHLAGVEAELQQLGFDVPAAQRNGQLVAVDAEPAVARHTLSGTFDAGSCMEELMLVLRASLATGRPVRVFGELVAVLWDAGDVTAAFELEDAWNPLSRDVRFSLLCAYPRTIESHERGCIADVCVVHAAVVGGAGPARVAVVERAEHSRFFAYDLQSPGMARRFVAQILREWGRADLIEDASIVAAELATNAVMHAQSEFVVGISRDTRRIRVSVRDGSTVLPAVATTALDSVSGRGLRLVGLLAREWSTELLDDGKVVWAELG